MDFKYDFPIKFRLAVVFAISFLTVFSACNFKHKKHDLPSAVIEENGNIYFLFADGKKMQITSLGKDKDPILSHNQKFVIWIRQEKKENSKKEDAQNDGFFQSSIVLFNCQELTTKVLFTDCQNEGTKSNFDYASSALYPFNEICNLEKAIISDDDSLVFFQAEAWVVCSAIHKLNLTNNKLSFYKPGWLEGTDKMNHIIITITDLDTNGRFTQRSIFDRDGHFIENIGDRE